MTHEFLDKVILSHFFASADSRSIAGDYMQADHKILFPSVSIGKKITLNLLDPQSASSIIGCRFLLRSRKTRSATGGPANLWLNGILVYHFDRTMSMSSMINVA